MAKASKKTKSKKKVISKETKVPTLEPGIVYIAMEQSELETLSNLMSICAQTFENLALQAAQQSDDTTYTILAARQKLSSVYASKFVEFCRMPEPVSRDLH